MIIKVCGITTLDAGLAVESSKADFIGFVFAPSKRRVSPKNAATISASLSPSLKKVGVFVNESKENIQFIAEKVGLDYIQLHGDESAAFAKSLGWPIIKAFSIGSVRADTIRNFPCDYYLVDSPPAEHRGGSGETFDWNRLTALKLDHKKLILAGGLSTENVAEAIETVRPAGVDISSGVETDGIKDNQKINQFVAAAKITINV